MSITTDVVFPDGIVVPPVQPPTKEPKKRGGSKSPEYVGYSSQIEFGPASTGNYSLGTVPAGTKNKDLIIVSLVYQDHTSIGASPVGTGWSTAYLYQPLESTGPNSAGSPNDKGYALWYKEAGPSESDVELYINPRTGYQKYPAQSAFILVFRNATFSSANVPEGETSGVCPSVTIADGGMHVAIHQGIDSGIGTQNAPPTDMDLSFFHRPNDPVMRAMAAYQSYEMGAATGAKTWPFVMNNYEVSGSIVLDPS